MSQGLTYVYAIPICIYVYACMCMYTYIIYRIYIYICMCVSCASDVISYKVLCRHRLRVYACMEHLDKPTSKSLPPLGSAAARRRVLQKRRWPQRTMALQQAKNCLNEFF